jgi:hypothetical protein
MSARPARFPTRQAANDSEPGGTTIVLAVMCLLVGFLGGSVMTLNWAQILEWVGEFA